ncbi:HAD family hydrolase [Pseudonocardia pini]|uniref:HAD family hydrolase n=1 Tax=Pseudonocardia pini TaxID=2758030 RepID=UPI0035E3F5FF
MGDTEYDVVSARRAGYLAVAVAGGYRPRDALRRAEPYALLGELTELPALLLPT